MTAAKPPPAPSRARTRAALAPPQHFHAHSLPDAPESSWQPLAEHLQAVAGLAGQSAAAFAASPCARLAGLLHDLGKYTHAFQNRIRGHAERVDHATWGAHIAIERFGPLGHLVAYAIAGHHAGLANGDGDGGGGDNTRSTLRQRLATPLPPLLDAWQQEIALPAACTPPQSLRPKSHEHVNFMLCLWVRMLFSCLVDADFLDTEAFYARAEGHKPPRGNSLTALQLQQALNTYMAGKLVQAQASNPGTVNTERQRILEHVRAQSALPPGLFSLTVPTGGGKTLTSLAFGLDHAVAHGLRRVVYVIPFTSIVEQNAKAFRDALGPLGDEAVLEHHSAYADDPLAAKEARDKTHLAMENWDAPVIVTTAVQFFESLFAARPSACRKLHNIAGSVIVLDEAQTLPLKLLRPTLLALDELARNYRCSVIFCTATQPALSDTRFQDVIGPMRELAPEPERLFQAFKRVTVKHVGALSDCEITERLRGKTQGLCIVNNRLHARALYQELHQQPGAWHLSTLMYAKHRSEVLARVRQALRAGEPCRLVSTSLIEAGVDVSFPLVMRAEAGLDSVAQAAGRCNREGIWAAQESEVLVFAPDTDKWKPPKELAQFAAVASQVLRRHSHDPLSPQAIEAYFSELYWARGTRELDTHDLLGLLRAAKLQSLPFEDIARHYRLIDSAQATVIVPIDDEAKQAVKQLPFAEGVKASARALQPYTVQVPKSAFERLLAVGAIEAVAAQRWGDQFMVLVNTSLYDAHHGLFWDDPTFVQPAQLVL